VDSEKSIKGVSSNLHAFGDVEATGSYLHVSLVTVANSAISAFGWTRDSDDANVFRVSSVMLNPSSLACCNANARSQDHQLEKERPQKTTQNHERANQQHACCKHPTTP
jgi:hypothetical protein